MRLALAALLALAGLAARALTADALALDEFDALAQAALPFALLAGWPRSARAPNSGAETEAAAGVAPGTNVLASAAAWALTALAVLGLGAKLQQISGRPFVEWGGWYAALALVPAASEAAAALAARNALAARVHAFVWCVAISGPLLALHALNFAVARDAAADSIPGWLRTLASAAPLEFALQALAARTAEVAFAAALLPVLLGCGAVAAAAWLPRFATAARAAGRGAA